MYLGQIKSCAQMNEMNTDRLYINSTDYIQTQKCIQEETESKQNSKKLN
jgi:hypothetical protein